MKLKKLKQFLSKYIIYILIFIIFIIGLILFFDFNNDYTLNLIGDHYIELYLYSQYEEPGYEAYNKKGINVKDKVEIIGTVNVYEEGLYRLEYKIGNAIKYREIRVVKDPNQELTISLNSPRSITYWTGSDFTLPKAYAMDKIDGDISNKIIISGKLDINSPGKYSIQYSITNSRKMNKSLTLEITVRDMNYEYEEKYVNEKYTGFFKVNDAIYSSVILPNQTSTTNLEFSYVYSKNGLYVFKFLDKNGNIYEIEKEVIGVDREKPTISCNVYLYDNNSSIKVSATDNIGIKNYKYEYGNDVSIADSNTLNYSFDTKDVKVTAYDFAGNENSARCQVIDESTKYGRSYTKENASYNYWLYIPPTLSKRNIVPLVIFFHGKGECGYNLSSINNNSFPKYINQGKDYDFVMIAPQTKPDECIGIINEAKIKAIIDDVINKYNLDKNRVFVTGFSYGAKVTYRMVKAYPNFFAGAIPVAFDPPFTDYSVLYNTPIYAFHGTKDAQRYNNHKNALTDIINHNSKSKFFSVEGADHLQTPPFVYENNKEVLDFIANIKR